MDSEPFNIEAILKERRDAVARSIRPCNAAEAAALGEKIFPAYDNPWREKFFDFLKENPHAIFHHAELSGGAQLLYSRSHDQGIWFIPGVGVGILQKTGLKLLSEIFGGAS